VLAASLASRAARADVTVEACADSYTKGQEERLAGRLFSARTQFNICKNEACPAAIVQDCKRWVSEVEADLPTVLVTVTDATGKPVPSPSVQIDGVLVSPALLEAPIAVDAGPHVIKCDMAGYQPAELQPALRPEDRKLPVNLVLRPLASSEPAAVAVAPEAPRDTAAKPLPVTALAFAGVGAIALGTSLYLGLSAKSKYDELKDACAPNCPKSAADSVHTRAVISDVALATSIVAFGAAAWFYFSADTKKQPTTAFGLEPHPDGGRVRLLLSF